MPVRELLPDEEVLPVKKTVRELNPGEEVLALTKDDPAFAGDVARSQREAERQKFMQGRGPVERFGRQANVGIAEAFGAPVDLANFLIGLTGLPTSEEPALGSRQLRRGFAALGISPPPGEEEPDTLAGSMGRVTGAATSFLMPVVGAGGKAAVEVGMGLRAAPTTVRGAIVQDIGKAAIETPGKFLAAETVSAITAGAGGFIAREKFPDSPAASFIGEIVGGLTPAGAITGTRLAVAGAKRIPGAVTAAKILPTVTGIRLARFMLRPFTKAGREQRAVTRMQAAARDPERAAAELRGEFDETLPGAALTPAQKTGDEGLLSLERSVIESSEQLKGQADEQIAQATKAIRETFTDIGEGVPPEKTAEALEEGRKYIQSLMDTRMRVAALKADERIAALAPGATREDANLIAREEIVAARKAVNDQVKELWNAVPKEVTLSTEESTGAFTRLLADTPRAQQEDIPDIARRLLDPESNTKFAETESVAELQGLRSKLLEEAGKARAAGESNKARMADELAEAVLADLGAQADNITGEAGDALRTALDATAHMKRTFDRGPVGKVLAVEKRGAPKIPEALTLETTVGKGGPRAKVETQAIMAAAETPALRGAVEDFILDDLHRRAVRDGQFDSKKAEAFLLRQKDVLDDFPELRTKIESAIKANDFSKLAAEKAEGLAARLNDPKISRAAVFLKEPVEGAMERIAKSPKPDRTMRELVKQARRDATGDALKGLKTGFGDLVLSRASTRTIPETGDLLISGRAIKKLLDDGPVSKMFKTLLSPEEQKRMLDIADVAEKVEKAVLAKGKAEGIIADNPSLLFATIARVAGAQIGRKVAAATGGGTVQTPGIMSNLFRKAVTAGVRDPAKKLLMDAMGDEDLFASLLTRGAKVEEKPIRTQLNAWLLSIGAEELEASLGEEGTSLVIGGKKRPAEGPK